MFICNSTFVALAALYLSSLRIVLLGAPKLLRFSPLALLCAS